MTYVVDASALIAVLQGERGANVAMSHLRGALFSAVNFSETLAKLSDWGISPNDGAGLIHELQVVVVPFDDQLASAAANLRASTRYDDVSLGDRACLALAHERRLPILTADKKWSELDLGIEIQQIR